jgi:hypothetical protein
MLGTHGGLSFFVSLGLDYNEFEGAKEKYRDDLLQRNTECMFIWCRNKARDATALDKLKRVLEERLDIIEEIDRLMAQRKQQPPDDSHA